MTNAELEFFASVPRLLRMIIEEMKKTNEILEPIGTLAKQISNGDICDKDK